MSDRPTGECDLFLNYKTTPRRLGFLNFNRCKWSECFYFFFVHFTKIQFLRLEQSSLNVLPENLGVMKLLESLNLAGNYFRQIPSELSGLHRSLKYLDLSDNILADGYNSLPAGFGKQLPNLTHLRMKHMGLREIEPESMVGFKRLRVLDLSENKVSCPLLGASSSSVYIVWTN